MILRLSLILLMALASLARSYAAGSAFNRSTSSEDEEHVALLVARGDSCMAQYDYFHAMGYYEKALENLKIKKLKNEKEGGTGQLTIDNSQLRINEEGLKMKLAECRYLRADYGGCIALLESLPEDSLTHDALRELFYGYKLMERRGQQMRWGERLVKRYPMDSEVVADLALAYNLSDNPVDALALTGRYEAVDSMNILVKRQTADAQFFMKEYPAATHTYERLVALGDTTFNTHYSLGMCYEQLENLPLAIEHYGKAVALNDSLKAWPLYHLGAALVKDKQYKEGIHVLLMALTRLQPDDSAMFNLHWALADGYYGNEEYYSAIYDWKNCLKYNPQSLASLYNIAQTYELIEDNGKHAEEAYMEFLRLAEYVDEPTPILQEWMEHAKNFKDVNARIEQRRMEAEKRVQEVKMRLEKEKKGN